MAAEDGTATLTRSCAAPRSLAATRARCLTRRSSALAHRVRNVTNVLYSRIREVHRFDPPARPDRLILKVDNSRVARIIAALAEVASAGREARPDAVAEPLAWALEALGPVPVDAIEQQDWRHKVGEDRRVPGSCSSNDDADWFLGPAPKPGQVEEFAARHGVAGAGTSGDRPRAI
ncbi:hypothetical protein HBB16_06380 [Pseudonocardia sp. MCCB 268]|nr:hypothetical protein [Pseudonocardia cytotoxica]